MFEDPGIVKSQEYRYVYRKKADDVFLFYTALQLHYATLESIALDKPMVDHIIDTTKPNVDMIHKVSSLYLCCDVLWMELKCAYFIHVQRIGQGLKELRERLAADTGVLEEDLRGQKRKV